MSKVIKIIFSGDFVPLDIVSKSSEIIDSDVLSIIKSYDLHITNLECPLTVSEKRIKKSGPHIKANPECVEQLRKASVNVVCLANNHIFDFGELGIEETIKVCESNNIDTLGIVNRYDKKASYLIKEINGKKICLLNYCESEFSVREEGRLGANGFDFVKFYKEIIKVRSICDYVIVIYHGGNEMYDLPNPLTKKIFHFFVDLGADAVISHHTHVLSGYEIYKNKPIFFGLGNFYFLERNNDSRWYYGLLVGLKFAGSGIEFDILPFKQEIDCNKIRICNLEEKDRILQKIRNLSSTIQNDDELRKQWENFVINNKNVIIKNILGLKKYERFLYRFSYFRKFILRKTNLQAIYNIIRCESLNMLLINSIENELNRHIT